jgi:histidinol dehydrogenase
VDHPDFHLSFAKICEVRGYPDGDKIDTIVREIISNVRKKGDIAIKEYTHDLDSFAIESAGFAFSDSDFSKAESAICDEEKKALNIAAERIST